MRFLVLTSEVLAALFFVQGSHAASVWSPQSLRAKYCKEPTSCKEFNNDQKNAAKLWDESHAGEIADNFINKNGWENWVQRLDKELFPNDVSDSWDCFGYDTICQLDKTCRKCTCISYLPFKWPGGNS